MQLRLKRGWYKENDKLSEHLKTATEIQREVPAPSLFVLVPCPRKIVCTRTHTSSAPDTGTESLAKSSKETTENINVA